MNNQLDQQREAETAEVIRRAFSHYRAPERAIWPIGAPARPFWQRPRPLAFSLSTASVVAAVAAVVILQSLAQPQSAFASWTAVPGSPDPALAAIADHECRDFLGGPEPELAEQLWDEEQHRRWEALGDPRELPLVAQDRRGDVALALFTDGRLMASCVVIQAQGGGTAAVGVGEIEGERSGALRVLSGISHDGEPPLRTFIGDVAPDVAKVVIERDEGEPVTATVSQGYFLAWWPTAAEVTRIVAYDAEGNAVGTLEGSQFE